MRGSIHDDLALKLRWNGKFRQNVNSRDLIHDVPSRISSRSKYIVLDCGDLIAGKTDGIQAGDNVEVETELAETLLSSRRTSEWRNQVRARFRHENAGDA